MVGQSTNLTLGAVAGTSALYRYRGTARDRLDAGVDATRDRLGLADEN